MQSQNIRFVGEDRRNDGDLTPLDHRKFIEKLTQNVKGHDTHVSALGKGGAVGKVVCLSDLLKGCGDLNEEGILRKHVFLTEIFSQEIDKIIGKRAKQDLLLLDHRHADQVLLCLFLLKIFLGKGTVDVANQKFACRLGRGIIHHGQIHSEILFDVFLEVLGCFFQSLGVLRIHDHIILQLVLLVEKVGRGACVGVVAKVDQLLLSALSRANLQQIFAKILGSLGDPLRGVRRDHDLSVLQANCKIIMIKSLQNRQGFGTVGKSHQNFRVGCRALIASPADLYGVRALFGRISHNCRHRVGYGSGG